MERQQSRQDPEFPALAGRRWLNCLVGSVHLPRPRTCQESQTTAKQASPRSAPAFPAPGVWEGSRRAWAALSTEQPGVRGTGQEHPVALGHRRQGADGAGQGGARRSSSSGSLSMPPAKGHQPHGLRVARRATWGPCSEGPARGSVLCCHLLKILSKSGGAPLSFCAGPGNPVTILSAGREVVESGAPGTPRVHCPAAPGF